MHTRHPPGSQEAHLRTAWDMVHIKAPPWVAAAPGRARGRASTPRGGEQVVVCTEAMVVG